MSTSSGDAVPIRKCYVRFRDGHPDGDAQAYAYQGFRALKVEVVGYDWIDEIWGFDDLGPDVGLAGYVGDVHAALAKIGVPIPDANDYPDALRTWLRREVRQTTFDEVRRGPKPIFVKPVKLKQFNAFVYEIGMDTPVSVMLEENEGRQVPVWTSPLEFFDAEFRAYVLHRKVIDVRRYKGDWSLAPDRYTIESAVKAMGRGAPHAYCLDWGLTLVGRPKVTMTKLIEYNHAYGFGHYGLAPVSYARMIAARWHQLARGASAVDEVSETQDPIHLT
ncbi:MAG: ATP-grasp domain-containing protein [Polyangiales bacterium]